MLRRPIPFFRFSPAPLILLACLLATPALLRADYPIASHRYIADPAVLVHDGRVYLYGSNDDENVSDDSYLMASFVCISSADLKNWTDHGVVFRVPRDASWASRSWAPSVVEKNGTVYLYFANGASNIGVATADNPLGPFTDPRGSSLINGATPGASGPNMWLFDPYCFIDDDGQAYLYFGGNGEANTRVIKLADDLISTSGTAAPVAAKAPGFFEASWMNKRNGVYYFSYSTNTANGLRIDYMTSDNPTTGFTYGGVVGGQPPLNNNNNHHGIFEFKGNWYHAYHNRVVAFEAGGPTAYKRNLAMEPLFFNPDNSIQQISYTRDGITQVAPLNPFNRVQAETFHAQSGIETDVCVEGGMAVTDITNGDYLSLRGVNLASGIVNLKARVAGAPGGNIEVRLDSVDGPLIATITVPDTGGLEAWTTVSTPIDDDSLGGVHDLFFVFSGGAADEFLSFNWWQFETDNPAATTLPAQPFNLSAALSPGQIRLTWAGDDTATGYRVKRSLNANGAYAEEIATVLGTAFTDTSVTNGLTYYYSVAAYNQAGSSPYSSSTSMEVVTVLAPEADAYVRGGGSAATNFGSDSTLAAKTDLNDPGFTRISLLRFDVNGLQNISTATLHLTPETGSDEMSATQLDYDLLTDDTWAENAVTWNNQPSSSGSRIASHTGYAIGVPVEIDLTDAVVDEATGDGLLSIQIESIIAGPSKYVAFASRENASPALRPRITYSLDAPPSPTNLDLTTAGKSVTLQWDAAAGAASYLVRRSSTSNGPSLVLKTGITENSYTDTDVTLGESYYYTVAALNADNISPDSEPVAVLTLGTTFAKWVETHFPGQTDPDVIGQQANPDGDSYKNLWEYFLGLDPNNYDTHQPVSSRLDENGKLVLTFQMAKDLTGLSHSILQSNTLEAWTDIGWPVKIVSENESTQTLEVSTDIDANTPLFQTIQLGID